MMQEKNVLISFLSLKVDNAWVPARIETGDEWYLAGLPRMSLDGLIVRM